MKLETDLNRIKELSEKKENENWQFRSLLKGYDALPEEIDAVVHQLYEQVSSEIDCKTCANCCKQIHPVLDQKDIEKFVRGLSISVTEFKDRFLEKDEDPGKYILAKLPCPYLKDNLCTNYENRPKDCRSFPHLHKKDFVFRLYGVIDNYSICPIVYNVYELLKGEIWHFSRYEDFDDYDFM